MNNKPRTCFNCRHFEEIPETHTKVPAEWICHAGDVYPTCETITQEELDDKDKLAAYIGQHCSNYEEIKTPSKLSDEEFDQLAKLHEQILDSGVLDYHDFIN